MKITLQEERYFVGQRVSQVVSSNVNQLLVALWDEPGYIKLDRKRAELKLTYIEDKTRVPNNLRCTDLIGIWSDDAQVSSYMQYFVARTQAAINIIDIVKDKVYCLRVEENYRFMNRKTCVIPRDIPLTIGHLKDRIRYQIIYVTEKT